MVNINKKLINNYLAGEDTSPYSLASLENDLNFMKEVINASHDYKIYNLCSEELKQNCDFIVFLVNKFPHEYHFLKEIIDYYMINSSNDIIDNRVEVSLLATKYLKDYATQDELDFYNSIINSFYLAFRHEIEEFQKVRTEEVGLGFLFLIEESFNVRYMMAQKMLLEIFEGQVNFSLEKYLHKNFASVEELKNAKIRNFLLEYITGYDEELANFIKVHIELLKDIIDDVRRIVINWSIYEKILERQKINAILDEIDRFCMEYPMNDLFDSDVYKYIAKKFNLYELFKEYDEMCYFDFEDCEYTLVDFDDLSLPTKGKLIKLSKRVKRILDGELLPDNYINQEENVCRVIKFPFFNN